MSSKTYSFNGNSKNKKNIRIIRTLDRLFEKLKEVNLSLEKQLSQYPSLSSNPSTAHEVQLPQCVLDDYWCTVRSGNDTISSITAIERANPEITLHVASDQYGASGYTTNWPIGYRNHQRCRINHVG